MSISASQIKHWVAFGFGSGYFPIAPGTMGTLVGVLCYLAVLQFLPVWLYMAVVLMASVWGVWLCGVVSAELGVHDHPGIVWDEMVGFWWVMLFVPPGWLWITVAFGLFRFFDILKHWPIYHIDRDLQNGLGIMADDWLAALFSGLVLLGARLFL